MQLTIGKRIYWVVALVALLALAVAAVSMTSGLISAGGDDKPITGDALARCGAAALAHTDGGRVTDTEAGDEESYYEVEVTLENGHQVDVQLDKDCNVLSDEVDNEDEGDDEASDSDD